jgi:uncharacterized protein
MKVFIDTSIFVALLVQNEQSHAKVTKKYQSYRQKRAIFFTSYYVLDELFTRLLYYGVKDIKKLVTTLQEAIAANELTVFDINEAGFAKSLTLFLKFSDHQLSFTDATIVYLYKEFKLNEIFTLDSDFKKVGATISSIS